MSKLNMGGKSGTIQQKIYKQKAADIRDPYGNIRKLIKEKFFNRAVY